MGTQNAAERPTVGDWIRLIAPILVVAAFVVAAWRAGYFSLKDPQHLAAAADKADDYPWFAPVFVIVYGVIAAFAGPVSPLAYAAGAVFGVIRGTIFVLVGSMLGAGLGYWLARGIWADSARRLLGRYQEKLRALRESGPFLTAFRVQALPVVPFGIFNYAAGIASLRFWPFMGGTALGILPGTIGAVYVGDRIAAGFRGSGKSAFIVASIVMLALVGLSFLPGAIKKLQSHGAAGEPSER